MTSLLKSSPGSGAAVAAPEAARGGSRTVLGAALMLSAGALSDRTGARQAYGGRDADAATGQAVRGITPSPGSPDRWTAGST
ncbi:MULTISPECIES: hypothetical protein [unclassified Streptomyces]|uniref:hypothetical protein n=1 Tax=unclassified Streptomyces TaxID=2593676 RepID=UPI00336A1CCB